MALKVTQILSIDATTKTKLPLFESRIQAGFPSPADDFLEKSLDLNEHLIKNPPATFFVRVEGDSMVGAGIHSGDILIVDRSLDPTDKKVVIAILNGELTVKRIRMIAKQIYLYPENKNYPVIHITEEMNFEVWGVVTRVIHSV